MSENRRRWAIPAGIAVAVVALVVVALVRDPLTLDPETPEGTTQEYLQAISDERWEDAYAVLDPQRFADCGPSDIAAHGPGEAFTASLQAPAGFERERFEEIPGDAAGTTIAPDDQTIVEVTLRFGEPGPFGSGGWTTYEVFDMVSRDDFWWISGDPWPYFSWRCT
ncbi:MAG: hypothetical protein ACRDVL_10265 [Acidimicrobiia bacterium]